jgi:pimeloyl-ACP methyl ester carboxylesterase
MTDAPYQHRGGTGEPLVLIHPLAGTWRAWLPIIPALEARHDVLAVGLAGHYGCPPLPPGVRAGPKAIFDAVERDMDAAGFATAHLVGGSIGGWAALELARRGRARSVVVIAPGGGWTRAGFMRLRLVSGLMRGVGKLTLPVAGPVLRPKLGRRFAFAAMMQHGDRIPHDEAVMLLRAMVKCPVYGALLRGIGREGPLTNLDEIDCPVLFAWPTKDHLLPAARYSPRLRALIPASRWGWIDGCGHVPSYDDPRQVAAAILNFTGRHEAARTAAVTLAAG